MLTLLCILWLLFALARSRRIAPGPCAVVLLVILAAVALRTGLMAYIDATTYVARGERYVGSGDAAALLWLGRDAGGRARLAPSP